MHLTFQKCVNVKASNLVVTAPWHSPNTDGIHVTETQNIQIHNCVIRTGIRCKKGKKNKKSSNLLEISCAKIKYQDCKID
jgi:polygalacturonase